MQRWKQEIIQGAGLGAIAVWMGACLVTPLDTTTTDSDSESESTEEGDDDTNNPSKPTTNPTEVDSETGVTSTGTTTPDTGTSTTADGVCGDGEVDGAEVCDDGKNDGSYGSCTADCSAFAAMCGDGTIDPEETCDDGNNDGSYNGCASDCQAFGPKCQDGNVDDVEQCDDGNAVNDDDCSNECELPICGDNIIQVGLGEVCDDGKNDGTYGSCTGDCSAKGPHCGDLNIDAEFESCDDGNGDNQDGCLGNCKVPQNCQEVLEFDAAATDGVYKFTVADTSWSAYCDMTTDGGGWTLAAKVAPNNTWRYTNPIWLNATLLSGDKSGFDHTAAKLATWNTVPFTQIHLGLEPVGNQGAPTPTYITLDAAAESLFGLFSPDSPVATTAGKSAWTPLMPDASLQEGCDQEGINNVALGGSEPPVRVRIGILSDSDADCGSPNSVLGLGMDNLPNNCMLNPFTSGGNLDCSTSPTTKKPGFGWIFVR